MPPIDPKKRHWEKHFVTEKEYKDWKKRRGKPAVRKLDATPSQIPPHRKEQMMREFKKYGGPRPKGSVSGGPRPKGSVSEGGRAEHNIGGRANLLEEMGRIDARRHPDAADRAEKRRVIGELNRGYKKGGLIKGKPKLAKKGWN